MPAICNETLHGNSAPTLAMQRFLAFDETYDGILYNFELKRQAALEHQRTIHSRELGCVITT
jgi:hypothetical protein